MAAVHVVTHVLAVLAMAYAGRAGGMHVRMCIQAPALSLNGASARAQMPPQSRAAMVVMH